MSRYDYKQKRKSATTL